MDRDPTDEELREFVELMLSNLEQLREPAVIDEAIRDRREMWVLLYRASLGHEVPDARS